jgi:hypothetical protein
MRRKILKPMMEALCSVNERYGPRCLCGLRDVSLGKDLQRYERGLMNGCGEESPTLTPNQGKI